ncbi:MAG TPA: tetratricopeptide repeat protein [Rudaea sp.]
MHQYGASDVERLLGLSRSTLRALVTAGFVQPTRGVRKTLLFSFQDLIVLRTAQALSAANLPSRRITKALRELRRQLPESMPLSGLRIETEADRVVVREGKSRWQADSGQYLLAFEGDPEEGSLSVLEKTPPPAPILLDAARVGATIAGKDRIGSDRSGVDRISVERVDADWFDRAIELEDGDIENAIRAYENAIAADPKHLDARINLGRLLHERGQLILAERVYREAIAVEGGNALLWFNFGVLLEDRGRASEAASAYAQAVRADPAMADAHYNLALLYEQLSKPKDAIRHMAEYRRLVAGKPRG